jgi:cell division protein FtsX
MAEAAAQMEGNPFPASVEVRLRPEARDGDGPVESLARQVGAMPGVADVRYDRRWLERLNTVVTFVRGLGLLVAALLIVASALTVANVVRLAASARSDEIHIMQLVGAPIAYVRGPFVVEGILQGGLGALVALLALWGAWPSSTAGTAPWPRTSSAVRGSRSCPGPVAEPRRGRDAAGLPRRGRRGPRRTVNPTPVNPTR